MSGGSMDYIYVKVREAADMAHDKELSDLLEDAAKVLKAQEWWYSSDISKTDYLIELDHFKRKWFSGERDDRLKKYVDEELERTRIYCYEVIGMLND